ncbi:MAG TPA: hypothetical protein VM537_27785 [Anaerolineae bacterium]|nr:hypothetical protein [Anaerolineae bacterium]
MPSVFYPGHIDTYDLEQRDIYTSELVAPGNENALTTQIELAAGAAVEPPETEPVVFPDSTTGATFEGVLTYYQQKMWSEGLPIIPPTKEKVEEFLKYTDYPADAILTRPMAPSYREATPWWVGVNGVMAGCRPEYMPVLIALTKLWSEPAWKGEGTGNTPGVSELTIISGPIKDQLGVNYHHTYGRPTYQSNTSIGRFWSMYQRNLLEIRVETGTDMGTHGLPNLCAVAENDELCHSYGWKTLAEEQGFQYGDNVVHSMNVNNIASAAAMEETTAEGLMWKIIGQICEGQAASWQLWGSSLGGGGCWHQFFMTKVVSDIFAAEGWDKDKILDSIYNNAKRTARYFETRYQRDGAAGAPGLGFFCEQVKAGASWARPEFCESEDPDRLVPMFPNRSKLHIILTGDEVRNRVAYCQNNSGSGDFASMKIELPENWDALYAASQIKKDLDNVIGREWKCL